MKIFLFFLIFATLSRASDEDLLPADYNPRMDAISSKYEAGSHLIFDCEEGHWACVLAKYSTECEQKRESAIKSGEKFLPCAPIGQLPSKRACFQKSLYLSGQAHGKRFCLLDTLKKEEIP